MLYGEIVYIIICFRLLWLFWYSCFCQLLMIEECYLESVKVLFYKKKHNIFNYIRTWQISPPPPPPPLKKNILWRAESNSVLFERVCGMSRKIIFEVRNFCLGGHFWGHKFVKLDIKLHNKQNWANKVRAPLSKDFQNLKSQTKKFDDWQKFLRVWAYFWKCWVMGIFHNNV